MKRWVAFILVSASSVLGESFGLNWDAVPEPIKTYNVYLSMNHGPWVHVGSTTNTSFTLTVTNSGLHAFCVTAVSELGEESGPSNVASGLSGNRKLAIAGSANVGNINIVQ